MKEIFEKVNIVDAGVVVVTGAALIICAVTGQQEGLLALGGGLVGYLGGTKMGGGSNG